MLFRSTRLEPRDIVISFNYDTLLEQALEAVGKPYRLFPFRLKSVDEAGGVIDSERDDDEVIVLKVHGSIDWFDRSHFERRMAWHKERNATPPEDIIFSYGASLGLERLVHGPCHNTDPLKNIYRARDLKALYAKNLLFKATPRILQPSATKLLYATRLNDFWRGIGSAGYYNHGMAIVGFSLPVHDDYARQILYGLVTNYQRYNWDKHELGGRKAPLAIIDFFSDTESEVHFRHRYRFVDWSRANLSGRGFDLASLGTIFA